MPNDLGLCMLLGDIDKSTLREIIIDQSSRNSGDSILVSGHLCLKSPLYVIPAGKGEDTGKLKTKLNEAFHEFKCLVNSNGKVRVAGENLLELECSTTYGMSGSPVFFINDENAIPIYNSYTLCGVYVGGPPLAGQCKIVEIVRAYARNRNAQETTKLIDNLNNNTQIPPQVAYRLRKISEKINANPNNLEKIENYAVKSLRHLISANDKLKDVKSNYYFNVAIPTTHPTFQVIVHYSSNFKNLLGQDFTSAEDLISIISK